MVKKKKSIGEVLASKSKRPHGVLQKPIWNGPWKDGITQSLLGGYLICKERFRLRAMEGWSTEDGFSHRLEYGNMWHVCEEALAANRDWRPDLLKYCQAVSMRYRKDSAQVEKWYQVCKLQFPVYVSYWAKNKDVQQREPLFQEVSFAVPYELASGRSVLLRGKWDSVDYIGKGRNRAIYLQENKSKGDVDEAKLKRQLYFDAQTGIYLTALKEHQKQNPGEEFAKCRVAGIRYNVIRRPLSGGKGSIRPHKATKNKPAETLPAYYARLGDVIEENKDTFFVRWKVEVSDADLYKFQEQFLRPVMENLLDDYEWWECCMRTGLSPFDYVARSTNYPHHRQRHYRFPYGVWNPLTDGTGGDFEEMMTTGSTVGLTRTKNLFPELN